MKPVTAVRPLPDKALDLWSEFPANNTAERVARKACIELRRHRAAQAKRCTCGSPPMSGHFLWCEALRGQPEFRPGTGPGKEHVRSVVAAQLAKFSAHWRWPADHIVTQDIARRVAAQLAGREVVLGDDRATLEWLKSLVEMGIVSTSRLIDGIGLEHSEKCRRAVALLDRLLGGAP